MVIIGRGPVNPMGPIDAIKRMDIADVDLNLLVTLDCLLRCRSVSRAAQALGASQPAVSYALKRLRALFEDPLFVRHARGLDPTPRAEALGRALQPVLDRIRTEVLAKPSFDPAQARRTLALHMIDVGELVFLPALLGRLRAQAPGVDVRTVTVAPGELVEALRSGEVDLAIGRFADLRDASLVRQRLFSHSFVCVVRDDHPQAGSRLTRRQFEQADHAVIDSESRSNAIFEQALATHGLARRVALRMPHHLAVPAVVIDSGLVVTVPYAVGAAFARMAAVRILQPPFESPLVDVHQWWHARFGRDPFNRWVRETVAGLFGEPSAGSRRARGGRGGGAAA